MCYFCMDIFFFDSFNKENIKGGSCILYYKRWWFKRVKLLKGKIEGLYYEFIYI